MNSIDGDLTDLIEMSVGDFNHFLSCACIVLECRYKRKDGSEYKLQHCIKFVLEFSNTYVTLMLSIKSFWIIINTRYKDERNIVERNRSQEKYEQNLISDIYCGKMSC